MKKLELYTSYNREEIHDILSPNTKFTKSAGTWGLQGLVRIENSNDFVFMVTEVLLQLLASMNLMKVLPKMVFSDGNHSLKIL